MATINYYTFSKNKFHDLRKGQHGINWPVVYLLENGKKMYIGETTRAYHRCKEHSQNQFKCILDNIYVISDELFNMSATKDIESWLIQYIAAEGSYQLLNGNRGLANHKYFDKERYRAKFELIWEELKTKRIVNKDLIQIKNSDLFKYSPYKTLSDEQLEISNKILAIDMKHTSYTQIIHGSPGTGKTILAIYLVKELIERGRKAALVVPMTQLRSTLKKVFKNISGLKANMVIGPSEVLSRNYEVLIVDEAHRLKRRKNITNYRIFDTNNAKLGLGKNCTELDWINESASKIILFYDEEQTIRPSDIRHEDFVSLDSKHYYLTSQLRVAGGTEYMDFINDLFEINVNGQYTIKSFEIKLFTNIDEMRKRIIEMDKEHTLSRLVAGYAWEWKSKNINDLYDIEIDNVKLKWNTTIRDWINSENSINEVGCIHTVQGYDLNYVGVIIGPELSYDNVNKKFIINKDFYYDKNGCRGITDIRELEKYIINIYKVLATRGIKGVYFYIVDDNLREYFEASFSHISLV